MDGIEKYVRVTFFSVFNKQKKDLCWSLPFYMWTPSALFLRDYMSYLSLSISTSPTSCFHHVTFVSCLFETAVLWSRWVRLNILVNSSSPSGSPIHWRMVQLIVVPRERSYCTAVMLAAIQENIKSKHVVLKGTSVHVFMCSLSWTKTPNKSWMIIWS